MGEISHLLALRRSPNGTHFEPLRASVRAGTLVTLCESGPHTSALRLKTHKASTLWLAAPYCKGGAFGFSGTG